MVKKFAILVVSIFLLATLPNLVFAKTVVKVMPKPTPTASPVPAPVNSFELFWPMVAGKTMQSKVYFLKTLKEDVRGFFIFGSAQKADYDIFLGIKRMLEAEALMKTKIQKMKLIQE